MFWPHAEPGRSRHLLLQTAFINIKVIPFGMKNSPVTFQRLIDDLISDLDCCKAYIDDAIIFSDKWKQHLETIRSFFDRISEAKLTINSAKNEFCPENLRCLGHMVGHGQVKPVEEKVEAISDFPCTYMQKTTDAISWYGRVL